jgi:hypothetical protein
MDAERKESAMRMLMQVLFPVREFNESVRDGTVGEKLQRILADADPEAVYFVEEHGQRSAILVVDVAESVDVPALAEPWFLTFNADTRFRIAMTPDDLARAGLDELSGKWG